MPGRAGGAAAGPDRAEPDGGAVVAHPRGQRGADRPVPGRVARRLAGLRGLAVPDHRADERTRLQLHGPGPQRRRSVQAQPEAHARRDPGQGTGRRRRAAHVEAAGRPAHRQLAARGQRRHRPDPLRRDVVRRRTTRGARGRPARSWPRRWTTTTSTPSPWWRRTSSTTARPTACAGSRRAGRRPRRTSPSAYADAAGTTQRTVTDPVGRERSRTGPGRRRTPSPATAP